MPIIHVEMLPGRSQKTKERIVHEMTALLVRELGVDPRFRSMTIRFQVPRGVHGVVQNTNDEYPRCLDQIVDKVTSVPMAQQPGVKKIGGSAHARVVRQGLKAIPQRKEIGVKPAPENPIRLSVIERRARSGKCLDATSPAHFETIERPAAPNGVLPESTGTDLCKLEFRLVNAGPVPIHAWLAVAADERDPGTTRPFEGVRARALEPGDVLSLEFRIPLVRPTRTALRVIAASAKEPAPSISTWMTTAGATPDVFRKPFPEIDGASVIVGRHQLVR